MKSLAENFEQIFVDAAMAETGNFTETACQFNLC